MVFEVQTKREEKKNEEKCGEMDGMGETWCCKTSQLLSPFLFYSLLFG
jgi:hypothetical protein